MLQFLTDLWENKDITTLVTKGVFILLATCVFFLYFCFAKKRNLRVYTYVVIASVAVLFGLSFFVQPAELRFYVYFSLVLLGIVGLLLFEQDLSRSIFRLSIKRKISHDGSANHFGTEELSKSVSEIVKACLRLSKTDTGALIIVGGNVSDNILESGIRINAEVTAELLETVFFPKTPLHDGAVVITGNKVEAASCYLPLTQETNLPREFGTRHRAAIGVANAYPDLTAIVVSEETGIISAMHDNKIRRYLDSDQLQAILNCAMGLSDESSEDKLWGEGAKL